MARTVTRLASDGEVEEKMRPGSTVMVSLLLAMALSACSKKALPPPLMPAAVKGDSKDVQALLAKGAEPGEKNSNGWTPLLVAAERGHTAVVQALLTKGAEVNAKEPKQGRTALFVAAANGDAATLQVLLAKGADVDEKDNN